LFRHWWQSQKSPLVGEIELKDTRGKDSLPFSELHHDQRVVANMATSKKGVLVRRSVGTVGGADYTGLQNSPYWIVIKYPHSFEIISYNSFILEEKVSNRKSLTAKRARDISTIGVDL